MLNLLFTLVWLVFGLLDNQFVVVLVTQPDVFNGQVGPHKPYLTVLKSFIFIQLQTWPHQLLSTLVSPIFTIIA